MDFRTKIQELIEQGKSFDEISKMFENEFNAAMVAASEENLDAIYDAALDSVEAALDEDADFTKEVVANAAACWAIETHDNWGKDEIELVRETLVAALDLMENAINAVMPLFEEKQKKDNFGGELKYKCTDKDVLKKFLATL